MSPPTLLAAPNVSEGRDEELIAHLGEAFCEPGVRLLDVHSDPDHNRSVFTLAGPPRRLSGAIIAGATEVLARVNLSRHSGVHPCIGALDVAPVVFREQGDAGAACAEALVLADRLGEELELPVFLYGVLAGGRTRAELRAGGRERLAERIGAGELTPDFGPRTLHPTGGAVLVAARPPLVAFNLELAPPATLEAAKEIAASIREGGSAGLAGVRAIGTWLDHRGLAQVSTNVEDHQAVPLRDIVSAVAARAQIAATELVGLAPSAALDGFPDEVPLRGRATVEDALQASD